MADSKKENESKPETEEFKVDLSEFTDEGFIRLNPEPRYYNVDGAGTLWCIVLDRTQTPSKKFKDDNVHYTCVAMKECRNGPILNKDTGVVEEQPLIRPGDTIRVGGRHQIDHTFPKVCGKKALVVLKPLRKVPTAGGQEVWQFAILAKPLTPKLEEQFAQFHLGEFESLE